MNYQIIPLKPFGIIVEALSENCSVREIDISYLKTIFKKEHILLLRGFKNFTSSEEFADYCELWGEISLWPFGKVLELVQQENPQDHIFDSSYVPLHWDGMYRPFVPEYQIFECVIPPLLGHGGRTTFSNTILALENASPELKKLWSKVTGVYQREMEFYKSRTIAPIISNHPYEDYSVIRYNEPPSLERGTFINPPNLEFKGAQDQQELDLFHESLTKALYDPRNFYAHTWQKGDLVITDNFSLLHGRETFVSKSPRHLRRVQVLSDPSFKNPHLESYQ